ncbi:Glycoprotein 3-alpha-L-fucosyltransferase A, partial [Stegodyphus mimosarum]
MLQRRIKRIIYFLLFGSALYFLLRRNHVCYIMNYNSSFSKMNMNTGTLKRHPARSLGTHIPMPTNLKGKKLPFHHIFESREIGFPDGLQNSERSAKRKIILLWTPWNSIRKTINYYFLRPGNKTFVKHNCPNPNCVATQNRKNLQKADAVLFHLIDTNVTDLPLNRTSNQIWILYNMEPPWQVKKHMLSEIHKLKNTFNWTMSYRSNSDVTVKYGIIMPLNKNQQKQVNLEEFEQKSKNIVWFVSDCSTDSRREEYVNELKKFIDIDTYGKCGDHKCYPSQSAICYDTILNRYKFYLSFENAICNDYVTEKFYNIFNYNIIPIVFGGANYSTVAPKGTFIDANDYPQPRLLANALKNIANNRMIYSKILGRKAQFRAYLDPWMCRLCDKLHTLPQLSLLADVERWWLKDAQCKRWNNVNQTYVNASF